VLQRVKRWARSVLQKWVLSLIADRLLLMTRSYNETVAKVKGQAAEAAVAGAKGEVAALRRQLAALQAIDLDFRHGGKIIVVAKVNGKDIVKIVEIAPRMNMEQWRFLSREIEDRYGISERRIDGPPGISGNHFL